MAFHGGSGVKNLPDNAGHAGETGLTSGSGRPLGRVKGNPLQYWLGNPMDRGACQATVHGVAERQRFKRLSAHSR